LVSCSGSNKGPGAMTGVPSSGPR